MLLRLHVIALFLTAVISAPLPCGAPFGEICPENGAVTSAPLPCGGPFGEICPESAETHPCSGPFGEICPEGPGGDTTVTDPPCIGPFGEICEGEPITRTINENRIICRSQLLGGVIVLHFRGVAGLQYRDIILIRAWATKVVNAIASPDVAVYLKLDDWSCKPVHTLGFRINNYLLLSKVKPWCDYFIPQKDLDVLMTIKVDFSTKLASVSHDDRSVDVAVPFARNLDEVLGLRKFLESCADISMEMVPQNKKPVTTPEPATKVTVAPEPFTTATVTLSTTPQPSTTKVSDPVITNPATVKPTTAVPTKPPKPPTTTKTVTMKPTTAVPTKPPQPPTTTKTITTKPTTAVPTKSPTTITTKSATFEPTTVMSTKLPKTSTPNPPTTQKAATVIPTTIQITTTRNPTKPKTTAAPIVTTIKPTTAAPTKPPRQSTPNPTTKSKDRTLRPTTAKPTESALYCKVCSHDNIHKCAANAEWTRCPMSDPVCEFAYDLNGSPPENKKTTDSKMQVRCRQTQACSADKGNQKRKKVCCTTSDCSPAINTVQQDLFLAMVSDIDVGS